MLQYTTSARDAPYNVKTAGNGLGMTTVVGCGVTVGGVCSDESGEHDKRGNMKAMVNRETLNFIFGLLLQLPTRTMSIYNKTHQRLSIILPSRAQHKNITNPNLILRKCNVFSVCRQILAAL